MQENDIIIDDQSGFRPYHSTETILLDSTNEWLKNMDKGLMNGVLFLDLKKAFDTYLITRSTSQVRVVWSKRAQLRMV